MTERQLKGEKKATEAEVRAVAALLPGGVRDMVSTRGRRYRELGLAGQSLTDEELVRLLVEEPGLWRRPLLVIGQEVVFGFDPDRLHALLS